MFNARLGDSDIADMVLDADAVLTAAPVLDGEVIAGQMSAQSAPLRHGG